MRKKEIARLYAQAIADLRAAETARDMYRKHYWTPVAKAADEFVEIITSAHDEGYDHAYTYMPRAQDRVVRTGDDVSKPYPHLLGGFPVERWAYDAGYNAGVEERDAYEARRDAARGKGKSGASFTISNVGVAFDVLGGGQSTTTDQTSYPEEPGE